MLYREEPDLHRWCDRHLGPGPRHVRRVTYIATHFATTHGARHRKRLGDGQLSGIDLDGIKAGFGVDPADTDRLSYAQLQERRALINKRLGDTRPKPKLPFRK